MPTCPNPGPAEVITSATPASRVQMLNDALRRTFVGGRVMLTAGINALPHAELVEVIRAVRAFDAFTPDNDPYGEHDCAVIVVGSTRVIWKIDCYDRELAGHSPDPADPAVTLRVLTLMLAEEY